MAARATSQDDHQKPWMVGNKNHQPMPGLEAVPSPAWEAEVRRLTALGIDPEELKIYNRTINSWNESVNKLNDEIARKLNIIAGCRRDWYQLSVQHGDKKEIELMYNEAERHQVEIKALQKKVTRLGGQSEQIPILFDEMPSL